MDKKKCSSCGGTPHKCSCKNKEFTKAVVEINNPEQITLMRKVVIPVSMGDDTTVPPTIGKYYNVLLYYEANQKSYLYSSDGIPTQLVNGVTDYEAAVNLPQINGVTLLGDKSAADLELADAPMVITVANDNTSWSGADTAEDVYDFFLNKGKVNIVFSGGENYTYEIASAGYIENEGKLLCVVAAASTQTTGGVTDFDGNALFGTMTLYTAGKAVDVSQIELQPKLYIADFTGLDLNYNELSGVPATNASIGMVKPGNGLEVASDGTLSISDIEQYAHFFDTVADMKAATNLVAGDYVRTGGFYTVNDGGGALYRIVSNVDAEEHQEQLNNGAYATLIVENGVLNVRTLGAKSSPDFDNTSMFQEALSYANKYAIYFPYGLYRTSHLSSVTVDKNVKIYGDNASIKLLDNVITADGQRFISLLCANDVEILVEIFGLNVDMNYTNNHSVIDTSGDPLALQHCHAIFVYGSSNSDIDVMIHDVTLNDLIADGVSLGGDSTRVINKAILNNVISKNRTPLRSDVCITCDFDSLNCSNMVLDNFEIEVNSIRDNKSRTILLTNLDLKTALDLDIGTNNTGEDVLYAHNIKVNKYFYSDIKNSNYTNCIFRLNHHVRLHGVKATFSNCDFYTEDNTNFNVLNASTVAYIVTTTTGSDIRFRDCNIKYDNTALSSTSDTKASFLRGLYPYSRVEFDNCVFDTSTCALDYRGGETYINNCTFKTANQYVTEFCRFNAQTADTTCNVHMTNNKTSSSANLLGPPIAGSAIVIYENNPAWVIGQVIGWTRFDKITSFNGGTGSIITIKEFTEFMNDSVPNTGKWIKGQRIKNSNPSTDYMWVCTKSGSLDSGSTVPTFVAVSL